LFGAFEIVSLANFLLSSVIFFVIFFALSLSPFLMQFEISIKLSVVPLIAEHTVTISFFFP